MSSAFSVLWIVFHSFLVYLWYLCFLLLWFLHTIFLHSCFWSCLLPMSSKYVLIGSMCRWKRWCTINVNMIVTNIRALFCFDCVPFFFFFFFVWSCRYKYQVLYLCVTVFKLTSLSAQLCVALLVAVTGADRVAEVYSCTVRGHWPP